MIVYFYAISCCTQLLGLPARLSILDLPKEIPGDQFLDLEYTELLPDRAYTLEILYGDDGTAESLFQDVPFLGLCLV